MSYVTRLGLDRPADPPRGFVGGVERGSPPSLSEWGCRLQFLAYFLRAACRRRKTLSDRAHHSRGRPARRWRRHPHSLRLGGEPRSTNQVETSRRIDAATARRRDCDAPFQRTYACVHQAFPRMKTLLSVTLA